MALGAIALFHPRHRDGILHRMRRREITLESAVVIIDFGHHLFASCQNIFSSIEGVLFPREDAPVAFQHISQQHLDKARCIIAMEMLIPDSYTAPGETERLKARYQCGLAREHRVMSLPLFHNHVEHARINDTLFRELLSRQRGMRCPLCNSRFTRNAVWLDVRLQNEIFQNMIKAINTLSENQLAAGVRHVLHRLGRREQTLPEHIARGRLHMIFSYLPWQMQQRISLHAR
jgi:Rad3-related DNA helicase